MAGLGLERQGNIVFTHSDLTPLVDGQEVTLTDFRAPNEGIMHITFQPIFMDSLGASDDITFYFYMSGALTGKEGPWISAGPSRIAPANLRMMKWFFTIKPNQTCKVACEWNNNSGSGSVQMALNGFGRVFPRETFSRRNRSPRTEM